MTSTALVQPKTGELLDLKDAPTDALAEWLAAVRDIESEYREAKGVVTRELLERMDREARWTVPLSNGWKLVGDSPAPTEGFDDIPMLLNDLRELAEEGVVSREAVEAAFPRVITFKADRSAVGRLRKLGGRVAEVIAAHAVRQERDRRVSVRRAS